MHAYRLHCGLAKRRRAYCSACSIPTNRAADTAWQDRPGIATLGRTAAGGDRRAQPYRAMCESKTDDEQNAAKRDRLQQAGNMTGEALNWIALLGLSEVGDRHRWCVTQRRQHIRCLQ